MGSNALQGAVNMVTVKITIPATGNKPAWTYSQEVSVPGGSELTIPEEEIPDIKPKKVSKVEMVTRDKAFNTQNVTIIASVICGSKVSSGDDVQLIIDKETIETKKTSDGQVSFTWEATPGIHTICVATTTSSKCNKTQDCSKINVSSTIPDIYEKLKLEREEYKEARKEAEERRRKLREEIPSLIKSMGKVNVPSLPTQYTGTPIKIDGDIVATVPESDTITLPNVPPGDHDIIIQPSDPSLPPITIPITVGPGETIEVTIPEEFFGGL